MPRFRLTPDLVDDPDERDDHSTHSYDDLPERWDDPAPRRRRSAAPIGPRVVDQGRSGRILVEVDTLDTADQADGAWADRADPADLTGPVGSAKPSRNAVPARLPRIGRLAVADPADDAPDAPFSSYDVATHGPDPVPDWLITSLSARDTPLGVIKSGKEADVSLLDRSLPGGPGCLLAVKTFRSAQHRMFHRDAGYTEGRRVRRSRETRAMATRTQFGRELLSGQWATAEFGALSALWQGGARVPYPVQLIGSELMMEFIGGPDGDAAPRLAAVDGNAADFTELWHDLVSNLEVLAEAGYTHGDLSGYNVLVDDRGCVLIDLPQVVDIIANPQGTAFLERDCRVIAEFFARKGVAAADPELLALHLGALARP